MNISLQEPKKCSIWDNVVPIVEKDGVIEAFITEEIQEPCIYNELYHRLNTAGSEDTVILHLNTPGGMIDSAFMIIDAIKNSKARVECRLSGTVASAGTIIALACDTVNVADHTAFMIHNYSAGLHGKGHEMKARQSFMDSQLNSAFKEFYHGFLTEDEMEDVIDGKDMWLSKDEVVERLSAKA